MTISAGKMRMPIAKVPKKDAKALKMKSATTKKKKISAAKAMDDSISETISFVIKGHLTPLKSTVVAKKTNVGKKKLKIVAKSKAADSSAKKVKLLKKTREEKQVDLVKPAKGKTPKKPAEKKTDDVKIKKVNTKAAKNAAVTRKSSKQNMLNAINSLVSPDVERGDIGKSLLVNHAANKVKNEISEKLPKKNKQVPKVKTETAETKKQIKNDVVKRRKSPYKAEVIEKDKQIKEKKSEATGKKIKKSEELKMKNNASNSPQQDKNTAAKQKPAAGRLRQDVKDKPKKNRVSSAEHKQVNEDVKAVTSKTPKNNLIKEGVNSVKTELPAKKGKPGRKKQTKRKIKSEDSILSTDDTSSTSDEITLDVLRQHHSEERKIKSEPTFKHAEEVSATSRKVTAKAGHTDTEKKKASQKPAAVKQKLGRKIQKKAAEVKPKKALIKKGVLTTGKNKAKRKEDQRSRKMKLFGFWNGPKRHRVASLNALAKVHCLYENETRGALLDNDSTRSESHVDRKVEIKEEEVAPTRTLRSAPGLRGAGRHWDMHEGAFSSSEENESSVESPESTPKNQKSDNEKKPEKKRPYTKRRRNRCELIMDLKDMVVRKRMASLNASAILAASYSVEKRSVKSPKSEDTDSEDSEDSFSNDSDNKKKCYEEDVKKEEDRKVIEVRATPNKKVSVILNQDTDVTITGVYVNSTTRSTHHEGYCSIAGMQYRISAKSHTQTASTTVATETIMQSAANIGQENTTAENPTHPCKSYTPLSALSSMQPPGTPGQHGVPLAPPQHMSSQHVIPLSTPQHIPHTSPIGRRHGCPSAFSAPPAGPYGPPPPAHHHPPPPPPPSDPGYMHGYYQPAGPLINVPSHGHPQPASLGKPAPLSEVSSSPTPPSSHQPHSQSSTADSMDSDVIITSATTSKEPLQPQQPPPTYRYTQYPAPHPGYSYGYPPQYYPAPPPAPSYHHELCYPPNPYLHHKAYPPPAYRRHLTAPTGTQYYQANPPDLYHPPPSAPNQQNQQVVTANPAVSSAYQPPPSGPPPPLMESYPPPPPPTLVEPYPPPPHYYPGYGPAPPPSCYTHSPPTRTLPYINAAYQSCPCPMQSCPKNVHTGPLTGDSKRSAHISSIAKDSLPLPPVALALPLEPVSATGPPSPARGSAGMPPPPSPAGATYQPPPPAPKVEGAESLDCKPIEKRRKARVGKNMVRNNIAANFPENTMLLMCHPPQHSMCVAKVKREIESPEERKPCSDAVLKSKLETTEITPLRTSSSTEITKDSSSVKVQKDVVTCMKTEERVEPVTPNKLKETEAIEKTPEELLPCQKTVAENVKVKNMKRKLSITRDLDKGDAETPPPQKNQKIDKAKVNGSYKDLIKKHVPSIRINNGKRKLNIEGDRPVIYKNSKLKLRRTPIKRKLSPSKEETNNKRLKISKPLTASNLHNSKQNLKNNKRKCFVDFELSENKEPFVKTTKRLQVNSKSSISNKKLAPAILDSLFAKNNVDRTIECVVNGYSDGLRTTKKSEGSAKTQEKCKNLKVDHKPEPINTKSTNSKTGPAKTKIIIAKKVGASKRKTKCKSIDIPPMTVSKIPRRHLQIPRWSNGWTWKGEPFQAKIFLNSDETVVIRKCYPAMKHSEGDIIEPKDCVLLKAGPRRNDLPFVAKVAALWENPEDGEMMMSLLWYYRPEHTEQGRQPYDEPDEVFASRHKDTNSVACIEDKCYVLTFNEYCRYRKSLRRFEEGMEDTGTCIPNPEPYPRILRQPPSTAQTPPDLVFFCRRVYDFRQKRIVKNPS